MVACVFFFSFLPCVSFNSIQYWVIFGKKKRNLKKKIFLFFSNHLDHFGHLFNPNINFWVGSQDPYLDNFQEQNRGKNGVKKAKMEKKIFFYIFSNHFYHFCHFLTIIKFFCLGSKIPYFHPFRGPKNTIFMEKFSNEIHT